MLQFRDKSLAKYLQYEVFQHMSVATLQAIEYSSNFQSFSQMTFPGIIRYMHAPSLSGILTSIRLQYFNHLKLHVLAAQHAQPKTLNTTHFGLIDQVNQ